MRILQLCGLGIALGLACGAQAADRTAVGQRAPAASPMIAEDIADFPDMVLIHGEFALPAGWRWASDPKVRNTAVADFDGDGASDYMARIVKDDGARAVAIFLGRFTKPGRWLNPIIVPEKSLKDLDAPF